MKKGREIKANQVSLGNFFEFADDGRLEVMRQAHTTEDAGKNLFHGFFTFWGVNKLADRLMAFR